MYIIEEIKQVFKSNNIFTKLIYINLGVFLLVQIAGLIFFLSGQENNLLVDYLSVPADINALALQPWSIFTYMFLHEGFMHILFNLLWFFWFGRIFLEFLDYKKLLSLYIYGGIFGAIFFIIAYNLFPVFDPIKHYSVALGASASVLAIVIAISTYVPNYTINLMFIGAVKIKYIAMFSIILDILSISGGNVGGHIAHLGGALFGYLFALQLRTKKRSSNGFANPFKRKKKVRVTHKNIPKDDQTYNVNKAKNQVQIDKILEKISKSGYSSLTKEEKEILFSASKK